MKTVAGKFAVVALCATALTAVSQNAQAGTVSLTGSYITSAPTPLYGTGIGSNNVVNATGVTGTASALFDPTGPGGTFNSATTPWLRTGAALSAVANYNVSWFFAGAESGDTIKFTSGAFSYTEYDQNNNSWALSPQIGPQFIGTTTGSGIGTALDFTIKDLSTGTTFVNGGSNPLGSPPASVAYSYITPIFDNQGTFVRFDLTRSPSDWFAFGFNDNGSGDDNHDDYMGYALVSEGPPHGPGITPIPAALPLFGSVLGGGFLFGRFRKRRQAGAPVAAV